MIENISEEELEMLKKLNICLEEHLKKFLEKKKSKHDKVTAFIVSMMDSEKVHSFFTKKDDNTSGKSNKIYYRNAELDEDNETDNKLSKGQQMLDEVINHRQETLVTIMEKMEQQNEQGYVILKKKFFEMDDKKKEPSDTDYNFSDHTVFQKIAFRNVQDAVCHRVFYQLTNKKWEHWCRRIFIIDACIYLVSVVLLTFVVATSVHASHVVSYQSPIDYIRAVLEILLLINAARVLGIEIYQIIRLGIKYLIDKMNIFELVSPLLLILVLPFRYLHEQAHWYIYAAAYMVWLLQIVKYALVFRFSGVYVESLWKMITDDLFKFAILFVITITVFSGTFVLVLKAENTLELHRETRSFLRIFVVGLRVMIESGSIVDYTGDDGYNFVGASVMMVFMFFIIVILLNMLIAQLLNTYQKSADTSLKGFYVRRAAIVARLEREPVPWILNIDKKRKDCYEDELEISSDSLDFQKMQENHKLEDQHKKEDKVYNIARNNDKKIEELKKELSGILNILKHQKGINSTSEQPMSGQT